MASSSSRSEQTSTDLSRLYEVIKSGDINSVKKLLVITSSKPDEFDVDNPLLRQNHFKNNSLHIALQLSESVSLVKEIFKQCGSSKSLEMLMQQNMNGDTPLHVAAKLGLKEIVELFIDPTRYFHSIDHCCQRINEDYVYENVDVEKGITEFAPAFENSATKTNMEQLVSIANKKNNTALHVALRYQPDSEIPLLLIRAGTRFHYLANDLGETPLYLAIKFGTPDHVEQLLKIYPTQSYGAPGGRTVLYALAMRNSDSFGEASSKLVYPLKNIVKEVDQNGRTALHYAVHSNNSEFIDAVLKVDPSVCYMSDKDGMTALHHAAAKDAECWDSKVLKIMLRHCMDCWEVLDNQGNNFLHLAAQNRNPHVLKYVLEEISSDLAVYAIIGAKDKNDATPAGISNAFFDILDSNPRMQRIRRDWFKFDQYNFEFFESNLNIQSEKYRKAAEETEAEEVKKMIREETENYNQTLLVVSALIATVAFAANFTVPGGYNSDGKHKGMAVLANSPSFIVFLVSNSLAMVLSAVAILIQLVNKIISMQLKDPEYKKEILLRNTLYCNLLAIVAMMVAFVTGNYTVLSHLPGLAIPVCILGSVFFALAFFIIYKIEIWMKKDDVNWN